MLCMRVRKRCSSSLLRQPIPSKSTGIPESQLLRSTPFRINGKILSSIKVDGLLPAAIEFEKASGVN